MDPRWEVRSYLRTIREAWPADRSESLGLVYRGPSDFVLREGRWWRPRPRPASMLQGVPQACYGNSIAGCLRYGLRYVQGYASSPVSRDLVVAHAWNADEAGDVVDLTWHPVGNAYLGVELAVERADDATWYGDADPIDDYNRGWPLLRDRWRGERTPDPEWRVSPIIAAYHARLAGDEDESRRLYQLGREEAR